MLRKRETMKKKILQNDISSSVKAWWVDFFGGCDGVCENTLVSLFACMKNLSVDGYKKKKRKKEQRNVFLLEIRRKVQKENVLLGDHDNNNIDKKGKQKGK